MAFSASTIWEINAASDDIFPYNIVDSTGTGTFTLIVEGSATPPIVYSSNYNTLTGNLQTSLNTTYGTGNIICRGGSLGTLNLFFDAGSYANRPINLLQTKVTAASGVGSWTVNGSIFSTGTTGTIYTINSIDVCGGGFTPSQTMSASLYSNNATSNVPLLTTNASIFSPNDTGCWLFINAGAPNWNPGWYQIISYNSTTGVIVNAGLGSGYAFYNYGPLYPTTVSGVGTTNALVTGLWSIDRSIGITQPWVTFDGNSITITGGTGYILRPSGYTVSKADIGNWINLVGTGMITGRYYISAATTGLPGTQSWTVAGNSTSGAIGYPITSGNGIVQGYFGGCLTNPMSLTSGNPWFGSNQAYVKYNSVPYSVTGFISLPGGSLNYHTRIIGYNTNRSKINTDLPRPIFKATNSFGGTGILFNPNNGFINVQNINFDISSSPAVSIVHSYNAVLNSVYQNIKVYATGTFLTAHGAFIAGSKIIGMEVSGIVCTGAALYLGADTRVFFGEIHHNSGGLGAVSFTSTNNDLFNCLIHNNTGIGINIFTATKGITECVSYRNSTGIFINAINDIICMNTISYGNTGVGSADWVSSANTLDYNAMFNCAGQTLSSTGVYFPTNYNFVTLTGDPFVNGTGGNFALNTLGSQYALLKGTAYNGNYNSTAGYEDIGAAQHLDSPATTIVIRNQLVR